MTPACSVRVRVTISIIRGTTSFPTPSVSQVSPLRRLSDAQNATKTLAFDTNRNGNSCVRYIWMIAACSVRSTCNHALLHWAPSLAVPLSKDKCKQMLVRDDYRHINRPNRTRIVQLCVVSLDSKCQGILTLVVLLHILSCHSVGVPLSKDKCKQMLVRDDYRHILRPY
jgi:hypothetical protein